MKIAIVDDNGFIITNMMRVAEAAGHTVLGVRLGNYWTDTKYDEAKIQCCTRDVEEAAAAVKAFVPDLVFIDHDFGLNVNGEDFARKLGMPRSQYIGTSSSYSQDYCGQFLRFEKDDVGRVFRGDHKTPPKNHADEQFLELLK